ncbi:MAG: hypothetical protein NWQ13_01865 [Glaciimonas sp.]|nr:hypothetical protein [Glaciimonas sp.]
MTSLTWPKLKLYKRLTRLPLALEITLILVVKIALLFVLYKLCFSQPQVKKMRMPTALVEQHFLSPPQAHSPSNASATPTPSTSSEVTHDFN